MKKKKYLKPEIRCLYVPQGLMEGWSEQTGNQDWGSKQSDEFFDEESKDEESKGIQSILDYRLNIWE